MGWGIIDVIDGEAHLVDCGALACSPRLPVSERIGILYKGLLAIIEKHRPDVMAIEQPFVAENIKTALAIGKAQTIAILAAVNNNLPTSEYTPAKIKQQIANYGTSDKAQIQEMVRLLLHLDVSPEPADAADALAVALCHLQEIHLKNIIDSQKVR